MVGKNNIWTLIIGIIILSQLVVATDYNFHNATDCKGEIEIRTNLKYANLNNYNLKDCVRIDTKRWTCPCPTKLVLQTEQDNHYNFLVQYYIGYYKTDNNKRVFNFDINKGKISEKPTYTFPPFLGGIILVIAVLAIIGLAILAITTLKKTSEHKDNRIEKGGYDYTPTYLSKEEIEEEPMERNEDFKNFLDGEYKDARLKETKGKQ